MSFRSPRLESGPRVALGGHLTSLDAAVLFCEIRHINADCLPPRLDGQCFIKCRVLEGGKSYFKTFNFCLRTTGCHS